MPNRFTSLFDNFVLSRLEQMRIRAWRRFTNKSQGDYLAGRGGTSTEFSDYRDYTEGDDTRYVDWNLFARLHRPYLKLYRQEEDMHVLLLVDASSSMNFERKLERALQVAGAFGVLGLLNLQRVGACVLNRREGASERMPPCTGRSSLRTLFEFLEGVEGGGDAPVENLVEEALKRHRGRGVAVLVSDFLTFGDVPKALNRLFSAGLEVFAVQILGPSEASPEVTGDARFVDAETGDTLDVSAAQDLLSIYHEHRESFARDLESGCRKRAGHFLSTRSDEPLENILFDRFRRKGWVE